MELIIEHNVYVIGQLSARQQRHIAKRLAPLLLASKDLLGALIGVAAKTAGQPDAFNTAMRENVGDLLTKGQPLVEALAAMPDDDLDYLIETCLSVVRRKTSAGNSQVNIMVGERFQFEDITLPMQLQLAVQVIRKNLGNFMPALPGISSAG